jgi:hypothetical protein
MPNWLLSITRRGNTISRCISIPQDDSAPGQILGFLIIASQMLSLCGFATDEVGSAAGGDVNARHLPPQR